MPGGIVSNNPCIDAVLAEIASPGQISAISRYSHDPASASAPHAWAKHLPAIGTSAEEILVARPRLVLTGNLASSGTNAALSSAGVDVVALGVGATLAEDSAQIRQIARVIGRQEEGERLVARIERSIPTIKAHAPIVSAIIWQNGGFVAGKGTLQDELLARHGFRNASQSYGLTSWDILPLERLIRNPPQVIFMPEGGEGDDARVLKARHRLLRHLGQKTKVIPFPDRLLFCGGPTIIAVSQILAETKRELTLAARGSAR
ncbi:MAG: ABC transporter substrate-binding protein [Sphingorhabdus sp.]